MKASQYRQTLRPNMLKFALESRQTLLLNDGVKAATGCPCPAGRKLDQIIRRGVLHAIAETKAQEARLREVIARGGDWEYPDF